MKKRIASCPPSLDLHVARWYAERYRANRVDFAQFNFDQELRCCHRFAVIGIWEQGVIHMTLLYYARVACRTEAVSVECWWWGVEVCFLNYAQRLESNERSCKTVFTGMSCGVDFGLETKPRHRIHISVTCWQHRVFLPNHSEKLEHGSGVPGRHSLSLSPSLCLSLGLTLAVLKRQFQNRTACQPVGTLGPTRRRDWINMELNQSVC